MKTNKASYNKMKNEASQEGESLMKEVGEMKSMSKSEDKKEDKMEMKQKCSRSERKFK
jgi:hypothetical protein